LALLGPERKASKMEKDRKQLKQTVFLIYPGITLLELVGARSIFGSSTYTAGYRPTVVAENLDALETDTPLRVMPQETIAEAPGADILFVIGGPGALVMLNNPRISGYIQSAAETARMVCSTGTGSLLLASAGVLTGRQATTHWTHAQTLEKLGAHYSHQPWVEDGKFITGAGVSSAVDMSLVLGARLAGKSAAHMSQVFAEYNPEPPFGNIDWTRVEGHYTPSITR